MKQNLPHDQELRRFRAEAAALLDIKAEPQRQKPLTETPKP
jgi:hypothetical protein